MKKRNIFNQRGAYLVFTILTLGILFAFAALMADIGRVSVSSLEQKQLTDSAATFAIQSWIAPSAPIEGDDDPRGSIDTVSKYNVRLNFVRRNVAILLNDALNHMFGAPGDEIVNIGSNNDSGLELIPGTYLPEIPNTCNATDLLCNTCRNALPSAIAGRRGCFVESRWNDDPARRLGINSFKARISTRASAPIRYFFSQLMPGGGASQSAGFSSESFAFQRPRNFITLIDFSPSITDTNFNDEGWQRSRFTYQFRDGNGSSGTDCSNPASRCDFKIENGDDFAFNSDLYINKPSISDARCMGVCPESSNKFIRLDPRNRSNYLNAAIQFIPPNASPLFGTTDGSTPNIAAISGCTNNNGVARQYCDSNGWFASDLSSHAWKVIGDSRYANPFPVVVDENNPTWIRQPIMRRFKSDYFNVSVPGTTKRSRLNPMFNFEESPLSYGGSYLVEDPSFLASDNRYFLDGSPSNANKPAFFNFPTNDSHPRPGGNGTEPQCFWGGNANGLRGMFYPQVERNYRGPEPYNSILRGLFRIHDGIQQTNIPGDKIMVVPFDDILGSFNATIPLTEVIRTGSDPHDFSADQQRLDNLLQAINPHPQGTTFESRDQIRRRIQLGLMPDPGLANTNISRALASTILYLQNASIQGADNYLLLFSDFVATGTCSLTQDKLVNPNDIDAKLATCANSTDSSGGVNWVARNRDDSDYREGNHETPKVNDMPYIDTSICPVGSTGECTNVPQNRAWRALQDLRAKNGLLDKLKLMNITPIFFSFNGKDGGKPVFAHRQQNRCMTDSEVSEGVNGTQLASGITSGEWAFKYTYTPPRQGFKSKRFDQFYSEIGSLASSVTERGGKYIRLMGGCPCFNNCGTSTSSVQNKLNALCSDNDLRSMINGIPQILKPMNGRINDTSPTQRDISFYNKLNNTFGITQGISPGSYHDSGGSYLFSFGKNDWANEKILDWSCGSFGNQNAGVAQHSVAGMGTALTTSNLAGRTDNSFITSDIMSAQLTAWGTLRCNPNLVGNDMSDTIFNEVSTLFQRSSASIVGLPALDLPPI